MRKVFLYEIEIELKTFNSRAMHLQETQYLKLDFYMNYCNFFEIHTIVMRRPNHNNIIIIYVVFVPTTEMIIHL